MVEMKTLETQDYIRILKKRWISILALGIAGGLLSYGISTRLTKRFTSQTTVLVEQPTVPGDLVRPVVTQDVTQRLATMQQQILSRTRLEIIIDQFNLYKPEAGKTRIAVMEDLVERLQKAISVSPVQAMQGTGGGLPGFKISVEFDDAHLAQQLCTTITSMFMEKNLELRQKQAEDTTEFLGSQLEQAKANLDDQDTKLADFKRHNVGVLPEQEAMNFNLLMGLNSQLESVTQALNQTQQDKSFADAALAQQLADWQNAPTPARDPQTLEEQLSSAQDQLACIAVEVHRQSPRRDPNEEQYRGPGEKDRGGARCQTLDNGSGCGSRKRWSRHTFSNCAPRSANSTRLCGSACRQEEGLQTQIKTYEDRVQASPAIEQEYKELTRDYGTALDFYNDLLRKQATSAMGTDLERRQEGEQFMILDPANLPDKPSFPNKPVMAGGEC